MKLNFIKEAAKDEARFARAVTLVQIFYYVQIPLAFLGLIKLGAADPGRSGFFPIWPVAWAGSLPFSEAAKIVFLFYFASSALASVFWQKRWARILAFLGILQLQALDSSFGYINHQLYPWLYTAFIFMFLPAVQQRKKFLLVFWGAQALFLLTYSLAGLWKVLNISSFYPAAFALQISSLSIKLSQNYFFGRIFIDHPWLGWPLYLGGLYTEFFAVWAAFRPNLHKLWGYLLIGLHTGILLFMGIAFFESIILLSILFLASPFAEASLGGTLADLPLFGGTFKRLQKKTRVLGRSF